MKVQIVENVLDIGLIQEIKNYSFSVKECRTNLTSWNPSLISTSGTILLFDLKGELFDKTKNKLIPYFGNDTEDKNWSLIYTLGSRYSWLPWHDDSNHIKSMTVYLNDSWNMDYAGWFLYEEEEETKAILPSFNKGVVLTPPINHCTVMPNPQAPLRESLQVFVNKENT